MYLPYTYLLRHKQTGLLYYGVNYRSTGAKRLLAHPSVFWKEYFTSSTQIAKMIEEDGADAFEFEIRRTFPDAKSALKWEKKVIRRMRAVYRSDFINESNGGMDELDRTMIVRRTNRMVRTRKRNGSFKGRTKPWSDEEKAHFSMIRKGNVYCPPKLTEEIVRQIRADYKNRILSDNRLGKKSKNGRVYTFDTLFCKEQSMKYDDLTSSNAMRIIKGKTWPHVQAE